MKMSTFDQQNEKIKQLHSHFQVYSASVKLWFLALISKHRFNISVYKL